MLTSKRPDLIIGIDFGMTYVRTPLSLFYSQDWVVCSYHLKTVKFALEEDQVPRRNKAESSLLEFHCPPERIPQSSTQEVLKF